MNFRFVQYGSTPYPVEITAELVEVAGHLDKDKYRRFTELFVAHRVQLRQEKSLVKSCDAVPGSL